MAVYSIQRCDSNSDQIILDADNGLINIIGDNQWFKAPLWTAQLEYREIFGGDSGVLSIGSGTFCINVMLSLAEYIQCFHYFNEITESIREVTI